MFGFLNVYKPKGITSHDVVARLRRVTKIRQIGHTGTLDPFAEGVLPICIGKSTRLIEFLNDDKEYLATVQFGKNTDSYDIDGKIIEEFDIKITSDDIEKSLKNFEGEIFQYPPIYSAIKVDGKKLYEYAREGKSVEIKPRKVVIELIRLEDFDYENQIATIRVACSKGTYIRSIAYDLGKMLGSGAYLSKLVRTKAGKFLLNEAIKLDEFSEVDFVKKELINPLKMLELPSVEINDKEHDKVLCGQILIAPQFLDNGFIILIYNNTISAVAQVEDGKIKVKKVFG